MRTVYAIQIQLSPKAPQPVRSTFDDVVNRILQWVSLKYLRAWKTTLGTIEKSANMEPIAGHQLKTHLTLGNGKPLLETDIGYALFEMDWNHPHDADPSLRWITVCSVACKGAVVEMTMFIRIASADTYLRPISFDLGRPRIVTEILSSYNCTCAGWSIPKAPQKLVAPDVEQFVESVLISNSRTLPVIMISPDVWNELHSVDPNQLQEELLGFAQVVVLLDKWAAFKLTDSIGKALSCYNGAVRIYWPNLKREQNALIHGLFFPATIQRYENEGLTFKKFIFRMLSTISAFRVIEGKTTQDVRRSILDDERIQLNALRGQITSGTIEKKDLEDQLLAALVKIDGLSEERDAVKQDLEVQKANWAEYQSYMDAARSESTPELEPKQQDLESVSDALERAKKSFSGPLVFLDSAEQSAKDSPFKNPERLYEFFDALHQVAKEWRTKKGNLGRTWNEALEALGFDLRDQISQTSKTKYEDEYKFQYKGKRRVFERHVTIGAKQADKCVSVHWYRDDEDLVLAIGHCGRHLSNTTA